MGFAHTVSVLYLLDFISLIAPVVTPAVTLLRVIAAWMGVQEAHRLHGARSLLIPFVAIGFVVLVAVIGLVVAGGVGLTLDGLFTRLGIQAQ